MLLLLLLLRPYSATTLEETFFLIRVTIMFNRNELFFKQNQFFSIEMNSRVFFEGMKGVISCVIRD